MLFSCFSTGFSASPRALASRSRVADSAAVTMAWGEHIGEREWNHGPDGRASQLTRDHGKLVITLATTGNINTRENNAALPCSPKEMADDMHECIKAGVSVLHIHARNELLKPTSEPARTEPNPHLNPNLNLNLATDPSPDPNQCAWTSSARRCA